MKKAIILAMLVAMSITPAMAQSRGLLWMDVTNPVYIASGRLSDNPKVGYSSSTNYLRLVTKGDSGIRAAAKNGNITMIDYVDQTTQKFLIIFERTITKVYGE